MFTAMLATLLVNNFAPLTMHTHHTDTSTVWPDVGNRMAVKMCLLPPNIPKMHCKYSNGLASPFLRRFGSLLVPVSDYGHLKAVTIVAYI